jgi:hypothetical protein
MGKAKTIIGTITLRSAIQQINSDGGGEIDFASNLGPISSWNGVEPNVDVPAIINGGSLGRVALFMRLVLRGDGITVENIVVSGAVPADGIVVTGNHDVIANDSLGTDFYNPEQSGEGSYPDGGFGVLIDGSNNTVSGCVISGNAISGIGIDGGSNNLVVGNHIGTDFAGTKAIPNGYGGVAIWDGASGNTIGGTSPSLHNLISGNATPTSNGHHAGVAISGTGTKGNVVEGNFIGTDINGATALRNADGGVSIFNGASGNIIGGTANGAGNLISGNGAASSSSSGVAIFGSDTAANLVEGNLIGTDLTGTKAIGNADGGVVISGGATGNTIGGPAISARNLISGNGPSTGSIVYPGVVITDTGTTANVVEGNFIGTQLKGTMPLGNAPGGVAVLNGATGNTIGGTIEGAGNLISGNTGYGVYISAQGTSANVVQGNLIGSDFTGALPLGNNGPGVQVSGGASANTIGGTIPDAGNVISGNIGDGLDLNNPGTDQNVVVGNLIGTDFAGLLALGNTSTGLSISDGASSNTIGGTSSDFANVISGNGKYGVEIADGGTTGNLLEGNDIGTNATGKSAVANKADGVRIDVGASSNTIGGTAMGAGNIIAFNAGTGVTVGNDASDNSNRDAIEGNAVFGNVKLGIDLGNDGVTPNDSHGHSSGPNLWQNFPTLVPPDSHGTIVATLASPSGAYRIEFFANDNLSLDGGTQGQIFLGSANLTIGSEGTGSVSFNPQAPVPLGAAVTATATDANGNTSEFDKSYVLNFVTFQGDTFHPITSDVDSFNTYLYRQWQSGDYPHQWPVLYAAGSDAVPSKLTVSADWTAYSTTSTTGSIEAKGMGTDNINIEPTPVTVAGSELSITGAKAEVSFPGYAEFFPHFVIRWQLSFDAGKNWVDAGQSDNPLYVSGATNPQPDPLSSQFYLTVVDSEINQTRGSSASDKSTIVNDTWDLFVGGAVRQFSPAEPFSDGTEYGRPLSYYATPLTTGDSIKDTTQQLGPGYTKNTTVHQLLTDGDGQCAAWAELFLDMLLVNGISEPNDYVTFVPKLSSGFLVSNWSFIGAGTSGNPSYPYVDAPGPHYEVVKDRGVEGQNSLDPKSVFENHVVAKIDGKYYDPSYGTSYASSAAISIAGFYLSVRVHRINIIYIQKQTAGGDSLVESMGTKMIHMWNADGIKAWRAGGSTSPPSASGSPTSNVDPMTSTSSTSSFTVSMTGDDGADGSGLGSFSLYVSTDGGPFVLAQSDIPAVPGAGDEFTASTTFNGAPGHTYAFYSAATDLGGTVEVISAAAEASVTILSGPTLTAVAGSGAFGGTGTLTANLSFSGSPVSGATVTFALTKGTTVTTVGSATTNANGAAELTGVSMEGFAVGDNPGAVRASVASTPTYSGSSAVGDLTITPAKGTFDVTSTADDGSAGTLRWAIAQANSATTPSTIDFDLGSPTETITLTKGELALKNTAAAISIDGPGAAVLSISGGYASRVFEVDKGVVASLSGVTITEGVAQGLHRRFYGPPGGGLYNEGSVTISGCTLSGNSAHEGGGLFNTGTADLSDCVVSGNGSYIGGGLNSYYGTLKLTNCTVSGNSSVQNGAGVYTTGGTVSLSDCTISDNVNDDFTLVGYAGGGLFIGPLTHSVLTNCTVSGNAAMAGGGMFIGTGSTLSLTDCTVSGNVVHEAVSGAGYDGSGGGLANDGVADITDCTISGNSALKRGGGLFNKGKATITSSTISGNEAGYSGGGLYNFGGKYYHCTAVLYDAIVAGNTGSAQSASDIGGNGESAVTGSYNLSGTGGSGGLTAAHNNLSDVADPGLGPLANNGGPTETMALLPGSPAIGAGSAVAGVTTDQRGDPLDWPPDIGAYQTQGSQRIGLAFAGLASPSVSYGTARVTLSGTLASGTLAPPNGESVDITVNGVTQEATLGAGGAFSTAFSVSTLGVSGSPYTITYSYAGDQTYAPTRATGSLTVSKGRANLALTSSRGSAVYGQPITLVATVTPTDASPAGTVTFLSGSTPLGTVTLHGSDTATLTISSLAPGSHSISASYSGDGDLLNATSRPTSESIAKASTRVVLIPRGVYHAKKAASIQMTAEILPVAPGAGTPTGVVTFMSGKNRLGSKALRGGQATFTLSSKSLGNKALTVVYSGDGDFRSCAAGRSAAGLASAVSR